MTPQVHVYTVTWASRVGPCVRRFFTPDSMDGFILEWRRLNGFRSVVWDTPFLARAAIF